MWKLGKILGIDVSLHWTLVLLVAWTGLSAPAGSMLASAALISAVFGCVLLHEFGHSLAARQFGIGTSSIVLLPIGGVASLDRMPRDPKQELWVAVAGPLVNVVIAGILFTVRGSIAASSPFLLGWLTSLMSVNIGLVLFNMLPAFPMDGGRVLRAVSAMFMPYVQATNFAASIGRIVAILLGIVGVMNGHLMLIVIAGFVFFVGSAEARAVEADERDRQNLGGLRYTDPRPLNTFESSHHRSNSPHVLRALSDGQKVRVIWDDTSRVYRFAR